MSLVESDADIVHLDPFEEIAGTLVSLHQESGFLYVKLSTGTLRFRSGSVEADICQKVLAPAVGYRVSILRLADRNRPIVVDAESK